MGKTIHWTAGFIVIELDGRERRRRGAACRGAEQEPWKFTHRQGDAVTCKLCLRMRERARAKYPELK